MDLSTTLSGTGPGSGKLLFLAWHFPPVRAIASVRTWNIAKHLSRLGWKVTVVTPDPSTWRYVDDPAETASELHKENVARILTGQSLRFLAPEEMNCAEGPIARLAGGALRLVARKLRVDRGIGWASDCRRACSRIRAEDVDVILATGPPFTPFRLAKRLSDRLGKPYVLDYRDPWTGSPYSSLPDRQNTIRLEGKLLAGCSAVTIVSRTWAAELHSRFGVGDRIHVVTNGYDPEAMDRVAPFPFGHFAIVYAGFFYPPNRVATPIMAALARLREAERPRTPEWRFHYYGIHGEHVRQEAERFRVLDCIVDHGMVPRPEVLSAVRGSGLAVVVNSVEEQPSARSRGWIPAKIFETIGLKRPILVIAPPGTDVEHIAVTSGLGRAFPAGDVDGIARFIRELMRGRNPQVSDTLSYQWTVLGRAFDAALSSGVQGLPRASVDTQAR